MTATVRQWRVPAPLPDWDPRHNRAVREILDHLARELAEEYVRLMKDATPKVLVEAHKAHILALDIYLRSKSQMNC